MAKHPLLILSGFDPSGHAGLLRDVWTCDQLGQSYVALPTALTLQTRTRGIRTHATDVAALTADLRWARHQKWSAVKIGMLHSLAVTKLVIQFLKSIPRSIPIVWDPVMTASSGLPLTSPDAMIHAINHLLPYVTICTPNALEAHFIIECLDRTKRVHPATIRPPRRMPASALVLASMLRMQSSNTFYVKGGHTHDPSTDVLIDQTSILVLQGSHSAQKRRGTGCALATALSCGLANKMKLKQAADSAKQFMSTAIWQDSASSHR